MHFPAIGIPLGGTAGAFFGAVSGGAGCWRNKNRQCDARYKNCMGNKMAIWNCVEACRKFRKQIAPKRKNQPLNQQGKGGEALITICISKFHGSVELVQS